MINGVREIRIDKRAPGRKAGQIVIEVAHADRVTYELRVDAPAGEFIVVDGNRGYVAKTRDELQRYMTDLAIANRRVTWTRYIVIDYEALQRIHWTGGRLSIDDERGDVQVVGIALEWEVYDYSELREYPGKSGPRRRRRQIQECELDEQSFSTNDEEWGGPDIPVGAVPYTPERLALLKEFRVAINRLDRRLVEMFGGQPDDLGRRLDSVKLQGLLASGDVQDSAQRSDGESDEG